MKGRVLITVAVLSSVACAPAYVVQQPRAVDRPLRLQGTIRFDARSPTPTGVSHERTAKPARWVSVRAVDSRGSIVAAGTTDGEGRYDLRATTVATHLEVLSQIKVAPHDLMVSTDGGGLSPHRYRVPLPAATGSLHITDEGPTAGAFHILDALLRGAEAVKGWTGRDLPPFFAYWGRGITTEWSFYSGQRPPGSGRYTIELLGGEAGKQVSTDTDEHDETIVLHEFAHFIFDVLTTRSSHGRESPPRIPARPRSGLGRGPRHLFSLPPCSGTPSTWTPLAWSRTASSASTTTWSEGHTLSRTE